MGTDKKQVAKRVELDEFHALEWDNVCYVLKSHLNIDGSYKNRPALSYHTTISQALHAYAGSVLQVPSTVAELMTAIGKLEGKIDEIKVNLRYREKEFQK